MAERSPSRLGAVVGGLAGRAQLAHLGDQVLGEHRHGHGRQEQRRHRDDQHAQGVVGGVLGEDHDVGAEGHRAHRPEAGQPAEPEPERRLQERQHQQDERERPGRETGQGDHARGRRRRRRPCWPRPASSGVPPAPGRRGAVSTATRRRTAAAAPARGRTRSLVEAAVRRAGSRRRRRARRATATRRIWRERALGDGAAAGGAARRRRHAGRAWSVRRRVMTAPRAGARSGAGRPRSARRAARARSRAGVSGRRRRPAAPRRSAAAAAGAAEQDLGRVDPACPTPRGRRRGRRTAGRGPSTVMRRRRRSAASVQDASLVQPERGPADPRHGEDRGAPDLLHVQELAVRDVVGVALRSGRCRRGAARRSGAAPARRRPARRAPPCSGSAPSGVTGRIITMSPGATSGSIEPEVTSVGDQSRKAHGRAIHSARLLTMEMVQHADGARPVEDGARHRLPGRLLSPAVAPCSRPGPGRGQLVRVSHEKPKVEVRPGSGGVVLDRDPEPEGAGLRAAGGVPGGRRRSA